RRSAAWPCPTSRPCRTTRRRSPPSSSKPTTSPPRPGACSKPEAAGDLPARRPPPWWAWATSRLQLGQDLDSVVGDEEAVLELGGAATVGGDCGPAVAPHLGERCAHGDHGLDGERHARLDDGRGLRSVVMGNHDVGGQLL